MITIDLTECALKKYEVHLNLASALALRDRHGINVLRPELAPPNSREPLAAAIMLDPLVACDFVYGMLQAQHTDFALAKGDFANAMGLRRLEQLGPVVAEELERFFEDSGRPEITEVMRRVKSARELAAEIARTTLGTDGESSTSSPPSPESTSGDAPSGSSPAPPEPDGETSGAEPPAS